MSDTDLVDESGVEAEAGRPPQPGDDPAHRGTLELRDTAVRHLVERSSLEVAGTVRHSSALRSISGSSYPRADVRVDHGRALITLDVAAVWPCAVTQLGAAVREQVREDVTRLASLQPSAVDVTVHLVARDATPVRRLA